MFQKAFTLSDRLQFQKRPEKSYQILYIRYLSVRYKLQMTLKDLTQADPPVFMEGEDLIVTDPMLPTKLTLQLHLTDG